MALLKIVEAKCPFPTYGISLGSMVTLSADSGSLFVISIVGLDASYDVNEAFIRRIKPNRKRRYFNLFSNLIIFVIEKRKELIVLQNDFFNLLLFRNY